MSFRASSVTISSLTRRPPPLICRRASPFEATSPADTKALSTPSPIFSVSGSTVTVGSESAATPSTKVLRAVSAACSAAARPCSSAAASVASTFFASLISAPSSAARRAISPIGSVVKSLRNFTTSASSVFRQYCQKS
ncbi:MAG: hypothetical protein BGP06_05585 [Rhizobiales bacterium 65-9]|nr:MAG: hypothetical protein BGP06_05585 [Rhizobiales bacterium 65-9]